MDALFTSLLVLLSGVIVYLLINLKITRTVDIRFREFHKNTIHKDTAEFYREMESYAALMENKISRFNNLLSKNEEIVRRWDSIFNEVKNTKRGREIDKFLSESTDHEKKIAFVLEKTLKNNPENDSAHSLATMSKPAEKKEKTKAIESRPDKKITKTRTETKPQNNLTHRVNAIHAKVNNFKQTKPELIYKDTNQGNTLESENIFQDEDVAELVRGLQDNVQIGTTKNHPEKNIQQPELKKNDAEQNNLLQIFSKIGKALQPTLLGQEENISTEKKLTPNFADKLSVRVEKKNNEKNSDAILLAPDTYTPTLPAQNRPKSLAEKKLDPEQLNFLIQSLRVRESHKAALRTLIERGIPLKLISELSQIPESELELTIRVHNF